MRKIILTLAAIAAVGVALPVATNSASAETVVIKENHGHHYGWRHRDHDRVVVREHREHRMVVREGRRHHGATVGVEVR